MRYSYRMSWGNIGILWVILFFCFLFFGIGTAQGQVSEKNACSSFRTSPPSCGVKRQNNNQNLLFPSVQRSSFKTTVMLSRSFAQGHPVPLLLEEKMKFFHVTDRMKGKKNLKKTVLGVRIAVGKKVEVWGESGDPVLRQQRPEYWITIVNQVDEVIAPLIEKQFGVWSDIDQNEKIIVYFGTMKKGQPVLGYFSRWDLCPKQCSQSNQAEIVLINSAYLNKRPVERTLATIAHEWVHLVGANPSSKGQLATWLDEGLASTAEQMYLETIWGGDHPNTYEFFEQFAHYPEVIRGKSLLTWNGDEYSSYVLTHLFVQYMRKQITMKYGKGVRPFRDLIAGQLMNTHQNVEQFIKRWINRNDTFGTLFTKFRVALIQQDSKGPYGFGGSVAFRKVESVPLDLEEAPEKLPGGGAVLLSMPQTIEKRLELSPHIRYTHIQEHGWLLITNESMLPNEFEKIF